MIQWYWKLYRGDGKPAVYNRIIRDIRRGNFRTEAYVIALAANESDQFDLFPASMLLQPFYQNCEIRIIGVAENRAEAVELVRRIIQDTYNATGGANARARFRAEDFST